MNLRHPTSPFLLIPLLLSICLSTGRAQAIELVTEAEVRLDREAQVKAAPDPNAARTKAFTPGAPIIEVQLPKQLAAVRSPFGIQLAFKTSDDTTPDLKSFRVLYGMLKLDITSRLLEKARLTPQGLQLDEAAIPKGAHRLRVELRDTRGRLGELDVRLDVQ